MRKLFAIALTIAMLAVTLAGCGAPMPESPAETTTYATRVTTTTEAPTEQQYHHPRDFDWRNLNDERWVADRNAMTQWLEQEGFEYPVFGYRIGEFHLGMTFEEAQQYFSGEPVIEHSEFSNWKRFTFDGLVLSFSHHGDDEHFISSIKVTAPAFATSRGLRVGDNADQVLEIYGVPNLVSNDVWFYTLQSLDLFHITVINDIVTEIYRIGQAC